MTPPTDPNSNGQPTDGLREGLPPAEIDVEQAEDDAGFFTPTNIILLGMMIALAIFLLARFNLEELWNIAKAALGLSFVIFIHELGHFLAAKWCGVNVTTFSIGFGPPIPGCWFKWGDTTYKLAVLPLGGYVQMVGQVDGDESADDGDDPRSYRRKTVGQRMLIISAGVIMNAILAVVCFIAVYQGPGREHPSAAVGQVDSAGPVFKIGMPTGALITKIGGVDDPNFTDLKYTVIFSRATDEIPLHYRMEGEAVKELAIKSRKDKSDKLRAIGVLSAEKLQLATKKEERDGPFYAGTPAAAAGFQWDDVIVAMSDADDPAKVTPLPDDWRYPNKGQRDYFEFAKRLQKLAGKEIIVRVERKTPDGKKTEENLKVAPMYHIDTGAIMAMGRILAVREGSEAAGKVFGPREVADATDAGKVAKLDGDRIYAVLVTDETGAPVKFSNEDNDKDATHALDPERLPYQLRQWADRLDRANVPEAKNPRAVTLFLMRRVDKPGDDQEKVTKTLRWDKNWRYDRSAPLNYNSPMPIPELGIAYQIQSSVVRVTNKNAQQLMPGDIVKNVRLEMKSFKNDAEADWITKKQIEEGQWAFVSHRILHGQSVITKMTYKVERKVDGKPETVEVEIPITIDKSWPMADRGWLLSSDTRVVKADNSWQAIELGFSDTHNRMLEVFYTLRGIILRDISPDVIGGPLTIAKGAYIFAGLNFGEFIFFIGLISINLAVVNFLPIPVLDGGHMVFLIYEKLRGQPASEAIRIWATYAGLAVILCLMLFVLYLDVNRLFF